MALLDQDYVSQMIADKKLWKGGKEIGNATASYFSTLFAFIGACEETIVKFNNGKEAECLVDRICEGYEMYGVVPRDKINDLKTLLRHCTGRVDYSDFDVRIQKMKLLKEELLEINRKSQMQLAWVNGMEFYLCCICGLIHLVASVLYILKNIKKEKGAELLVASIAVFPFAGLGFISYAWNLQKTYLKERVESACLLIKAIGGLIKYNIGLRHIASALEAQVPKLETFISELSMPDSELITFMKNWKIGTYVDASKDTEGWMEEGKADAILVQCDCEIAPKKQES